MGCMWSRMALTCVTPADPALVNGAELAGRVSVASSLQAGFWGCLVFSRLVSSLPPHSAPVWGGEEHRRLAGEVVLLNRFGSGNGSVGSLGEGISVALAGTRAWVCVGSVEDHS